MEEPMEQKQIADITNAFPCFAAIPVDEWLRSGISVERFSPQLAMQEGHLFSHAAFVLSGTVRIHKISESGREVTLYRVKRGGVCVIMMASILGETGYEASAEIEEDTEILLLSVERFKEWIDTCKPLRQFIYQTMMKRMISVTTLIEDIAFKPINARIAQFLLSRTSHSCTTLVMTHDAIAIELGTAREVVSRTLKEFEAAGWLQLGRGRITAIQRAAIEQKFGL